MEKLTSVGKDQGVWFVYDGDCPICSMAAHALKIRQALGPLHLVDARRDWGSPLLHEIKRRKLNLDEGMVIWFENQFYHGKDALRFMAQFGAEEGWFNRVNRTFFQSETLSRISYPWLRAGRNLLLKIRGVGKLDNLRDDVNPLFKSVFSDDWEKLPTVMQRHYANRAFRNDVVRVIGTLNIHSSPIGRLLKPAFRWVKVLAPEEGRDIPVTVDYTTDAHSNAFRFNRLFHFPEKPAYAFRSAMFPIGGNELVEMMGRGIGWRVAYRWDGQKVILSHQGYVLRLFQRFIPLPITWLLGEGYAEEMPVDDDTFSMWTEIRHPLWGKIFGYDGTFKVTKDR